GIGFHLQADNSGDGIIKTTQFGADYAYRVAVNDEFFFKLGVEAGFRQSTLDWDRLVFLDQLDPVTGEVDQNGNPNPTNEVRPEELSKTFFDVGAGLLAYGGKFYGGIALHHLTTPDEGFLKENSSLTEGLPLRVSVHGGAQFIVKEGNKRQPASFISPNILLLRQGGYGQLNLGAYYSMGLVFAGGWFRHSFGNSDAVIAMVGFQKDILKIGYSYDFTVSALAGAPSGGAHEISLVINLENSEALRKKRWSERYNDCFNIFR
ncbi:MAG: PorP/SprF family type IX secretion system membrane protein, partial [Bacteroidota bacterium]